MVDEKDSADDESLDNELLCDVVKYTEDAIPKRRRITVNVFKIRKSQHTLNEENYSKAPICNINARLKVFLLIFI